MAGLEVVFSRFLSGGHGACGVSKGNFCSKKHVNTYIDMYVCFLFFYLQKLPTRV